MVDDFDGLDLLDEFVIDRINDKIEFNELINIVEFLLIQFLIVSHLLY